MDDNKLFGIRLLNLREYSGESQEYLAKSIGITQQSLSRYESGQRMPNSEVLIKFSQHFKVSIDYLLGISDIKSINQDIKVVCDLTGLSEYSIFKLQEIKEKPYFEIINKILEDVEDVYNFEKILSDIFSLCNEIVKTEAFAKAVCELADVKFSLYDNSTNSIFFRNILIQLQSNLNNSYADISKTEEIHKKETLFNLPLKEDETGYKRFRLQNKIMDLIESLENEYKFSDKTIESVKQIYISELKKIPDVLQESVKKLQQKQKESNEASIKFFNNLFGENNIFNNF